MKIAIAADHGGFTLKQEIVSALKGQGIKVEDLGCNSNDSVDYPDFAKGLCAKIIDKSCEKGILICGTGIGMSMAANRYKEIRAALCHNIFTARLSREHNDANVLCLGARVIGPGLALEMVKEWLATDFAGERHLRRIEMF